MLFVADLTNGRPAIEMNESDFAGRQAHLAPVVFFREELS
jgi:hypothetical protein